MASMGGINYRIGVALALAQFVLGAIVLLLALFTPSFATVLGIDVFIIMGVGLLMGGVGAVFAAHSHSNT